MKWLLLMLTVASLLAVGRLLQRLTGGSGEYPLDVNEDSARRRLAALMPPIHREQR